MIPEERISRKDEIWGALFSKSHPCLRASMLPKRYGWGVHFNAEGKIALYAKESPEYDHFTSHEDAGVKLLNAMRSKRSLEGRKKFVQDNRRDYAEYLACGAERNAGGLGAAFGSGLHETGEFG